MVLDAVSNFVRGNTDAAVGTSDTTVSVADASIFPDPATDGEFNVVIWDVNNFPRPDQDGDVEIMRVTARDTGTNELTVTRGQEMTSASTHPEGSAIHLSPTAKMFSDIESTFGDFWDAGTQELTADVNNTNTTTTALEAESVTTDELSRGSGNLIESGGNWYSESGRPLSDPDDVTSTSYTDVANLTGVLTADQAPSGASLYGRMRLRMGVNNPDESGDEIEVRPTLVIRGEDRVRLDELAVSTDQDGNDNTVDSGWTEITSNLMDDTYNIERIEARVDSGTGVFDDITAHYVAFQWRVD